MEISKCFMGDVMISVVIPAYQAQHFIEQTILSVKSQTLKAAEIIVVDDGSTDCTAKIAESLGAKCIRQPNSGVSRARNVGIRAAKGEWIALLDADDLWQANKLELQFSALRLRSDAYFASCNHSFFDDNQTFNESYLEKLGKDFYAAGRLEIAPGVTYFERVAFRELNWIVPLPSSLVIHRDAFEEIGYFDEALNGAEDMEFHLRAMARFPFIFREEALTKYRQVPNSQNRNQLLCGASFLRTIEKIENNPYAYPAGVSETVTRIKFERLAAQGRLLFRLRRFDEAQNLFRESLRYRYRPLTLSLWLTSLVCLKTQKRSTAVPDAA